MKVYISGQITGIENEAPGLFEAGEKEMIERGFEVINPMKIEHNHDLSWLNYMRVDIIALMDCDAIYMLRNWKYSNGARIEWKLALDLGLKIYYEK